MELKSNRPDLHSLEDKLAHKAREADSRGIKNLVKYRLLQHLPGKSGAKYQQKYLRALLRLIYRKNDWPPFAIFAGDSIGYEITVRGYYENELIQFLENHVFPSISRNSIAMDIGANIGNHSNRFANYFDQVHAFEPNERVYYLLKANAMLTPDKIIAHNVGCSDEHFSQQVNYSSLEVIQASLEWDSSSFHGSTLIQTANFELVKLDEYLPSEYHSKVGFMKLDIEGHEIRALKGAENIILSSQPIIVFEAHIPEIAPYEYLVNLGYEHFYGFAKFKKRWHERSERRLVEVTNSNQSSVEGQMIIASAKKLNGILGEILMQSPLPL